MLNRMHTHPGEGFGVGVTMMKRMYIYIECTDVNESVSEVEMKVAQYRECQDKP